MEIKTFDTILTEICDFFDGLIAPRTITRSNTNIIYLIFKAVSKGYEIINNVCVVLSNKFNPYYCSEEDLTSVASLVGTERLKGAVSGLRVVATNNGIADVTLPAGDYVYAYSEDINFICTLTQPLAIQAESHADMMFLTDIVGSYPVTMQESISVTSEETIPSGITFSCSNNDALLGYEDETNLAFRQRITSDPTRQDVINELKVKLRNLPYVFDCEIVFNRADSSVTVGTFDVPPYYMLIMMSTALYKEEIAEIVAQSAIYPTVGGSDEHTHKIIYKNGVFALVDSEDIGNYPVYVHDFVDKEFEAVISYSFDTNYTSSTVAEEKMENGLYTIINNNVHKDAITTEDFFKALQSLELTGVSIFGVQLKVNNSYVPYVSCGKTEIGKLVHVEFSPAVINA